MKEKRARTWTPRLGLEVPDVLLPDIRDHPIECQEINERKSTHLIGAQPVLESYNVVWCYWTIYLDRECPKYMQLLERKGGEKNRKPEHTPPHKNHVANMLGGADTH